MENFDVNKFIEDHEEDLREMDEMLTDINNSSYFTEDDEEIEISTDENLISEYEEFASDLKSRIDFGL